MVIDAYLRWSSSEPMRVFGIVYIVLRTKSLWVVAANAFLELPAVVSCSCLDAMSFSGLQTRVPLCNGSIPLLPRICYIAQSTFSSYCGFVMGID